MINKLIKPFYQKLFFLTKLPLGWVAGLKVRELNNEVCVVSVPFKYWTKNPFRSIYFACLAMAGELSCGLLVAKCVDSAQGKYSMLVIDAQIQFTKKATERIFFTCQDGADINKVIQSAALTGEGETIVTQSIGKTKEGLVVASMTLTWSVKKK